MTELEIKPRLNSIAQYQNISPARPWGPYLFQERSSMGIADGHLLNRRIELRVPPSTVAEKVIPAGCVGMPRTLPKRAQSCTRHARGLPSHAEIQPLVLHFHER